MATERPRLPAWQFVLVFGGAIALLNFLRSGDLWFAVLSFIGISVVVTLVAVRSK